MSKRNRGNRTVDDESVRTEKPKRTSKKVVKLKLAHPTEEKDGRNLGKLLEIRKNHQKGRPKFVRQESWRYKRLETTWRKPKGLDSKMRKQVRGWPKIVKIGYRGPKTTRGLHPSGYRDILVHNMSDLVTLNPKTDAVRFSAKLGRRYRTHLSEKAEELGLKILNPLRIPLRRK